MYVVDNYEVNGIRMQSNGTIIHVMNQCSYFHDIYVVIQKDFVFWFRVARNRKALIVIVNVGGYNKRTFEVVK